MRKSPMFRAELAYSHSDRLDGETFIAIPTSWRAVTYLLFASLVTVLMFLFFGTYSRVEITSGTIVPDAGIAPVVATRAGVIVEMIVVDGESVSAGTPLATVRAEEEGNAAVSAGALVEAAIARQDANLAIQANSSAAAAQAQVSQLAVQQEGLIAEIKQLQLQQEAQRSLINSAKDDLDRAKSIATRGFISGRDLQIREETLLSRQQGLAQLEQALAGKRAALADSERAEAQVNAQTRAQLASLEASRAQVAQQAASTAASRSYALRAPVAGRVTALTARLGQPVSPQSQLMAIVPEGSRLTAELAVPSAAIGFVKPGQDVRLALDAFPYQRFGTVKGRIRTVPASTVNTKAPNGATIPVYPVIVDIEAPRVSAYGRDEPLVAGMSLTARIITEKQSLLEWLFEPLFAVRRR